MIVVGLLCFAIWLAFDAQQLFANANTASPLGTRRSVAMSVLRPIAAAERFVDFDRIVANADRAIGRENLATPGGQAVATPPTTIPPSRPHHAGQHAGTGTTSPSTTTTTVPPSAPTSVAQPTKAHPLTILDIGDSIGEDLGIGLGDVLGSNPAVKVIQDAVGNTGLADPGYYNWPANLANELKQYHPKVVVVMMGGNDWQAFLTGPNTAAEPGTAYWRSAYGQRVASLIEEAQNAGAAVFWVGLPPMSPSSALPPAMAPALNAVYQAQAAATGATYVSTWDAFSNSAGQYTEYVSNAQGQLVAVRDPDGVHLAPPAGCDLAATIVTKSMESTFHIKL